MHPMVNFAEQNLRETIRLLAEPILSAAQLELVELTLHQHAGQVSVRLLVDKIGGVTIQDCARVNQLIGQALDDAHLLQEHYTVEVSSPGLDRPLVSKRDFERAIGEELEIELLEAIGSSHQVKGQLLAVQPDALVITTSAGNLVVPLARIRRALKAVHW